VNVLLALLSMLPMLCLSPAHADEAASPAPLPAMRYYGSPITSDLYDAIKADPYFTRLEKELPGSPIVLRVTHTLELTSGGRAAALTTVVLAAVTLGIIPIVVNQDVVVTYEVLVNTVPVATYSYRRNQSQSHNVWNQNDKTFGLGADGLAWVKTTVTPFLAAAREDPALAALLEEYRYYFAAPAVADAAH
jgi:hypothetical protein